MTPGEAVEAVQSAAEEASAARENLHRRIRDAAGAGASLRAIAAAAGLSPETVRTIARET